jgi:hypothetical protein
MADEEGQGRQKGHPELSSEILHQTKNINDT